MKIIENVFWVYYIGNPLKFVKDKVGKWMYFFKEGDRTFIEKVCREVVEKEIVSVAKHSNKESGVACFYLNIDDIEGHKKVIKYFLENNMIRKTKKGKYYNNSFKLDIQTIKGQYGDDFIPELTLDKFINLDTGDWII